MRNVEFACPGNPQLLVAANTNVPTAVVSAATHHSQAHIRVDAHALLSNASHSEHNTLKDSNPAQVADSRNGFASSVSLPGSSHESKPKLLATVFDSSFDEHGAKSPLGLHCTPTHCNVQPVQTNDDSTTSKCDSDPDGDTEAEDSATPGPNTSDEESHSDSLQHNVVGNVPAYAFTSLDKWSMRRFRIRVNELQPSASARNSADCQPLIDAHNASLSPEQSCGDLLSDVSVTEYDALGHDCLCATAGRALKTHSFVDDGCNLSLPLKLSRCDYTNVLDTTELNIACKCDNDTVCSHRTTDDTFHTARSSTFCETVANVEVDNDPELRWFTGLQKDCLEHSLNLFSHNSVGFTASSDCNSSSECLTGAIRVYINLIRPIKMALSARPLTIYDLLPASHSSDQAANEQLETFLLPRGTTRLLYISRYSLLLLFRFIRFFCFDFTPMIYTVSKFSNPQLLLCC